MTSWSYLFIKGVLFARINFPFIGAIEFETVRQVSWNLLKLLSCLNILKWFSFVRNCLGRYFCRKIYICDNSRPWVFTFWMRLLIPSRTFCENLIVRFQTYWSFEVLRPLFHDQINGKGIIWVLITRRFV